MYTPEPGTKLRDVQFRKLQVWYSGLSIFVGKKEVAMGFFGEVLKSVPHLADYTITSCNSFFDTFVIRLEEQCENS